MKLYQIIDETKITSFASTLKEAHAEAKEHFLRDSVDIFEVEVGTGKANFVAAMNGKTDTVLRFAQKLRRWVLTPRGGLREVGVEEDV